MTRDEFESLAAARRLANLCGYFVVTVEEKTSTGGHKWILYREPRGTEPKAVRIGKRSSSKALLALVNKVTTPAKKAVDIEV